MRSRRSFSIAFAVSTTGLVASCTGGGGDLSTGALGDAGGASSSGGSSSGASSSGGSSGGGSSGGGTSSGGISSSGIGGSTGEDGGVTDAAADATPTSCVTKSVIIAVIQTASGQCSYKFTQPYDADKINLVLTPGWGTVCAAGSSSNCGSGSSADGWWFSASDEISVCDATCARFERQTIAGKFTVQLGCPTETCTH